MSETKSLRGAYGKTLVKIGEQDENVVALDCDLSGSTKSGDFAKAFPDRHFNMGIAEQDMIGTAAGLATSGKIPFASSFAVFATGRAWEPIRQSVSLTNLNVKIVASHAGITVGEDGKSHQSLEDIALMQLLPNFTVIVPADAVEVEKATWAIYKHVGPVYLRTSRYDFPVIYDSSYNFEIGKSHQLKDGSDITLIGCGYMVHCCLEAAEILLSKGISARVINMSTIKPLDERAIIEAATETGAIVTAEEHFIVGGLGSAVAACTSRNYPVPVKMVGIDDKYARSGKPAILLEEYGLNAKSVVNAALSAIKGKK